MISASQGSSTSAHVSLLQSRRLAPARLHARRSVMSNLSRIALPLVAVAIHKLLFRRSRSLTEPGLWIAGVIALALSVPWFAYQFSVHHEQLVNEHFRWLLPPVSRLSPVSGVARLVYHLQLVGLLSRVFLRHHTGSYRDVQQVPLHQRFVILGSRIFAPLS